MINKILKSLICKIFILVLFFNLFSNDLVFCSDINQNYSNDIANIIFIGETIKFGRWKSENDVIDAFTNFSVIDFNDSYATLVSDDYIDVSPYDYNIDSDWKDSYIRKWLNDYYYMYSFSDFEKKYIIKLNDDKYGTDDYITLPTIEMIKNSTQNFIISKKTNNSNYYIDKCNLYKKYSYTPKKYFWLKDRFYIARSNKNITRVEYLTKEIKDVTLSVRPIININIKYFIDTKINGFVDNTIDVNIEPSDEKFLNDNYVASSIKYYENNSNLIENGIHSKTVYLTFDDGPSLLTGNVLDILKKENVKATFFVVNYNDENKKYIKRIINEGHTLALHGYSHSMKKIYASEETFINNIEKFKDKIKSDFNYDAKFFRFPGGSSNTISKYNPYIMTSLVKTVTDRGYRYFDWNISSGDGGSIDISSDEIYKNVTSNLKNGEYIVLMHDSSPHINTINALPSIISYLKNNGYKILPITENVIPNHHLVNN